MVTVLGGEKRFLAHQLILVAEKDRYARDLSRSDLTQALFESTAHVPVYRTYTRHLEVAREDGKVIEQPIQVARTRKFYLQRADFYFIRHLLLVRVRPPLHAHLPAAR